MMDIPFDFIKESDIYCQVCYQFFNSTQEYVTHIETQDHKLEQGRTCCGRKFGTYELRRHQQTKFHQTHKDGFKTKDAAWAAYHRAKTAYWTKKQD